METETQEITKDILSDFIKNIPKDGTSGEFIALVVDFLKTYDNTFVKSDTIKKLLTNPPPDAAEILNKVNKITKTGDIIKAIIPNRITYGTGMNRITIDPQNTFNVEKLRDDLILMGMSGVKSGLLNLVKIKIYPEGVDVYTGKILGWRNVFKF